MSAATSGTGVYREGRLAVMVADGLGHGLHAHDAARGGRRVRQRLHETPARIIADVHAALRATRGAAVAVVRSTSNAASRSYCGLGNITASIVPPAGARHGMISQNGTADTSPAESRSSTTLFRRNPSSSCSRTGSASTVGSDRYPVSKDVIPRVIAGIIYRDFSRRRDESPWSSQRSTAMAKRLCLQ